MIEDYIALDIETSGLNPASDKVIEIGMAKVKQGEIVDRYQTLVNPGIAISPRITQLTGITDEMVKNEPKMEDLIDDVVEFMEDLPLLGHNIIFDYSFMKKAAVNSNLHFQKDGIDTLKLARRLLPELVHKNLEYLCAYFDINPGNSHRAYDDACSAMMLYQKLYEINPMDEGFQTAMTLNYNAKKDTPITPAQKRYLSSLVSHYHIELKEEISELTKSKASRLIDGILSEYGKMPSHS